MNAEMAKAILDSRKTQTRKTIKKFFDLSLKEPKKNPLYFKDMQKDLEFKELQGYVNVCPLFYSKSEDKYYCGESIKYQKGDIAWVREPAKVDMCFTEEIHFHYLANNKASKLNIPKRFIKDGFISDWMAHCQGVPNGCIKEMARIFLKITNVHVEKLQDVSVDDICKEGCISYNNWIGFDKKEYEKQAKIWFSKLWDRTAQKGYKWEDNPYLFVCEFKRVNRDGSNYDE